MAVQHSTTVFDVLDARVYALTSDVTGASPVYSPGVDVPGIGEFSLEPNLTSAELKGDSRIIASRGRADRFNWSLTYARFALDVLDTVFGSSVLSEAAAQATIAMAGPGTLPYFRLEVLIGDVDTGLGSLNIVLFKTKLTGGTFFQTSSDNFGRPQMQGQAIALDGRVTPPNGAPTDNLMLMASLNQTLSPLSL